MRIFVAWSGERSRIVSEALVAFFQCISSDFNAWVSHRDIVSGSDWRKDLASALKGADMGVICLTRTTIGNPWLAFEAGALSSNQRRKICPYLLDTDIGLASSPMSHFQTRRANRSDTLTLVHEINSKLTNSRQKSEQIASQFERCWPKLEVVLRDTPREKIPKRYNRLDLDGLQCLLAIHLRASVDRLVHAIEDGVTDPNNIDVEHILARVGKAVIEGRNLLAHFSTDQFGSVSELLESQLPLERLDKLLISAKPIFAAARDARDRHRIVFDFITREQEMLKSYIAKATRGDSE